MIPVLALKALPWRLIGYGLAVAALIAFGWRVNEWRQGYHARAAAEARAEQIAKDSAKALETVTAQLRASYEASEGYQNELSSLRAARTPSRPVRVCRDVPAASPNRTAASGPDAAAPASGALPQEPGPDIGPDLYRDADDADEVSARLRALQEWVRATR